MDSYILYVDMLGFSELVLNNPDALDDIKPVYRSSSDEEHVDPDDALERQPYPSEPPPTELGATFTMFHRCLNAARDQVMKSRSGSVLVFSDSAFYQVNELKEIIGLSRELMRNLIERSVPVRMGIGRGSFKLLRFMSDYSSQVTMHTSQFLGEGIVRAHRAEQCGAKGMRILIHPTVLEQMSKNYVKEELVKVDPPPKTSPVTHEVNFIFGSELDPNAEMDLELFLPVVGMMRNAPEEFKFQYVETIDAMNRMRVAYDAHPYDLEDLMKH